MKQSNQNEIPSIHPIKATFGVKQKSFVICLVLWSLTTLFAIGFIASFREEMTSPVFFAILLAGFSPLFLGLFLYRHLLAQSRMLLEENQTLQETMEKMETRTRAKSRFLAIVSHEIRTPLNGILGMAGLLNDTALSSEQRAYVEAVEKSGRILSSLINDILDYSKIEADGLSIKQTSTDIRALVEEVAELMAPRAHDKAIELATYIDPNSAISYHLDGERLKQVLFNLVSNAIKFTDKGGVLLAVENIAGKLRLSVKDSGIGIEQNAQAKIFEEFCQADDTIGRKYGGTGLGLAIASRIITAMQSTLELESIPNEGTTFSFTLAVQTAGFEKIEAPTLAGKSVLVAAPDGPERLTLTRLLENKDAHVIKADCLAETQAKLAGGLAAGEFFDILLFDARLRDDPGAIMMALRQAVGTVPPSIMLIAPQHRSLLDTIKNAGFLAYLMRPIRENSLMRIIEALIGEEKIDIPKIGFVHDPFIERREKNRKASQTIKRLSALLVEDNPINALLSRALLQREGFEVTSVDNGADAVRYMKTDHRFNLILMDLHMPGMDGLEATRKIRQIERELDHEPVGILALTADATESAHAAALEAGMDKVITKPIDVNALRQIAADMTEPEVISAVESR